MRRRDFVRIVGGTAMTWPLLARAQQSNPKRRIGILMGGAENDQEGQSSVAAFRERLRDLGWIEGRNSEIHVRWAAANVEVMKRHAIELVTLQPDLILTSTTPAAAAMLKQTRTIPVVFVVVADPVSSGFVASLPRPGGNATGFTPIVDSLGGKWVELLKEIAPKVTRVTMVFNRPTATFVDRYLGPFKAAAASLGIEAVVVPFDDLATLESVLATEARQPNSGLLVIPDAFTQQHRAEITALAALFHLPAVYWSRSFAEAGGLISYGPFLIDEYRRAASYVDLILKGAKPNELPVQAPVRFEFVVNLKSAKELGLDVPSTVLMGADGVID